MALTFKDMTEFWANNEVVLQKKKLNDLQKSGMQNITGFNAYLEMRKKMLQIALDTLDQIKKEKP